MSAPREASTSASRAQPGRITRREDRREALLGAAAQMFNRRGLRGTTLAEVAASVGLAGNSITHYFRRKEDLAVACLLRAIEAVVRLAQQAGATPDPAARVRSFIVGYLAMLAAIDRGEHADLVRFHDIRALEPEHREQVVAAYVPMFRAVRALLGPAQAGAQAQRAHSARTLFLLTAAFWSRAWIRRYDPDDYPLIGQRITDIVLEGLAAEGASWATVPRWQGPSPLAGAPEDPMRAAFLKAATLQMNEQGFRGASIDRIAARLNLTKGAFYHHLSDKDELIAACFERSFAAVRRAQDLARTADTGWERLLQAAGALTCHQCSDDGPLLRFTARSALPESMRGDARRTMDRLTQRYGQFVIDGIADGTIRPVDPSVAADLMTGTINAVVELGHWLPGYRLDEALDAYLKTLFFGLRRTLAQN